jgi:Ca2+-binding RTX toxin-like protein
MSILLLLAMLPIMALGMFDSGSAADAEDPGPEVREGTDDRDNMTGTAGGDHINALEGNDYVSGLGGNDEISLGGGNDHGIGGGGDDCLFGAAGSDVLEGSAGNDMLHGGDGNDILFDSTGHDTLCGDLGHDMLDARDEPVSAPDSADKVVGGYGYDTLIGDAGDTLSGGAWQDEFFVTTGGSPVVITDWEDGEPLTVTVPVGQREAVLSTRDSEDGLDLEIVYDDQVVAILSGQSGADVLPHLVVETFLPDELVGTADHDVLLGGAGNDVMIGYAGDDHIDADGGDDLVYSGAGNDFVNLGGGNDVYEGYWLGHEDAPSATDVDEIHAGAGGDRVTADGGMVVMFGDSGNDVLSAVDTLVDQAQTSDQIFGGIGQDTISGDWGDTLTGGSGADVFNIFADGTSADAPVQVEDFDPMFDKLNINLRYSPSLPEPAGQMTYEVDAAHDRVVVSIDGSARLILNNTQTFDPRWVNVTIAA